MVYQPHFSGYPAGTFAQNYTMPAPQNQATGTSADSPQIVQAGVIPPWVGPVLSGAAGLLFGGVAGKVVGAATALASGTGASADGDQGAGGISLGGPGVPEPNPALVEKSWKMMVHKNAGVLGAITGESNWWIYFWKLHDGSVLMFDPGNNRTKIWRPKKHIVISSNPRLSNLKKLDKLYGKVQKQVRRMAPAHMRQAPAAARGTVKVVACK